MDYAIYTYDGQLLKMTREEAYAHMETDAKPGDRIVVRNAAEGPQWYTSDGSRVPMDVP